jgi:hypothetical protein
VTLRPPTPLPPLVMEDQFDQVRKVSDWQGRVVVLIYGDRKSADANRALGEWIHVAFHPSARGQPPAQAARAPVRPIEGAPPGTPSPEVVTVAVASIGKVPAPIALLIKRQIRAAAPETPILLDFEERMKGLFGLSPGVPNLVLVDAQGRVRCTAVGNLTAEQLGQVTTMIEDLRREAVRKE